MIIRGSEDAASDELETSDNASVVGWDGDAFRNAFIPKFGRRHLNELLIPADQPVPVSLRMGALSKESALTRLGRE